MIPPDVVVAASTIWPVTIAGWVALVTSVGGFIAMVLGGMWAYAKFLASLNGLGGRVDSLESRADQTEARQEEMARVMDRLTASTEQLLREVGSAVRRSEDCDDNTEKFAIDIGSKLDMFQRSLGDRISALSERMAGVERELELGRQVRFNISPRGQ